MRIKLGLTLGAAAMIFATPASAQQLVLGSGWEGFNWAGLGTVNSFGAGNGLFSFTAATPFRIEIADCCVRGDQFSLSWTGASTGSFNTSVPVNDGSDTFGDPDNAFTDPLNSTGIGFFGAGSYNFDLATIQLATCCNTGSGWIRADASGVVPEPGTLTLMATGLVGMAGAVRRRRRTA